MIEFVANDRFSKQLVGFFERGLELGWTAEQMADAALEEARLEVPRDLIENKELMKTAHAALAQMYVEMLANASEK